jgi:hypothetical protein
MAVIMPTDFMKVLNNIKKHPSKSKHTLFSTICLMQEQKLNHRSYSEQEINSGNFVQATKHDVICKVWGFYFLCSFVNKYSEF